MVLLNQLEDCATTDAAMRDYTLFTGQEPCPMCLARICFNQVGKVFYVYRDGSSLRRRADQLDRLPPGFCGLADRLVIEEAAAALN